MESIYRSTFRSVRELGIIVAGLALVFLFLVTIGNLGESWDLWTLPSTAFGAETSLELDGLLDVREGTVLVHGNEAGHFTCRAETNTALYKLARKHHGQNVNLIVEFSEGEGGRTCEQLIIQ